MAQKRVRYDYFETWIMEYNKETNSATEKKVDLSELFNQAIKMTKKEATKDFRGEKARIQMISQGEDGVYEIQFLRLRETTPPGIATDEGEFELIKLEDNEYIGEFTAALYDSSRCLLIMHRNLHAFTPSGLEEYIASTMKDVNRDIFLKPIFSKVDIEKIINSKVYRSFNISVRPEDIESFNENSPLNKILKQAEKFDGSNINIGITVGRSKKDRTLDPKATRMLIQDAKNNTELNRFVINYKEFEDSKVEEIDLIDERMHDSYVFTIDREKPLTYLMVISKLIELYNTRRVEENI